MSTIKKTTGDYLYEYRWEIFLGAMTVIMVAAAIVLGYFAATLPSMINIVGTTRTGEIIYQTVSSAEAFLGLTIGASIAGFIATILGFSTFFVGISTYAEGRKQSAPKVAQDPVVISHVTAPKENVTPTYNQAVKQKAINELSSNSLFQKMRKKADATTTSTPSASPTRTASPN